MTDTSPHFAFVGNATLYFAVVVNTVVAARARIRNSFCYSSCHFITIVIICLQKLLDATWQRLKGCNHFKRGAHVSQQHISSLCATLVAAPTTFVKSDLCGVCDV